MIHPIVILPAYCYYTTLLLLYHPIVIRPPYCYYTTLLLLYHHIVTVPPYCYCTTLLLLYHPIVTVPSYCYYTTLSLSCDYHFGTLFIFFRIDRSATMSSDPVVCRKCQLPLGNAPSINALGQYWHQPCFTLVGSSRGADKRRRKAIGERKF